MRRSICFVEPSNVYAGEKGTWKFIYTTGNNLPKGTILKFDLASKGRSIDWEVPETSPKKTANVIYAVLPNNKVIFQTPIDVPNSFVPQFQFVLPSEIQAGANFTICMGAAKGSKSEANGNTSQLTIQRRRPFLLYVDPTGKGNFHDPEVFN